jgi:predicted transcriptional regulator
MVMSNLTIQLDDDTIRSAKVLAAERGTSVSAFVAQTIRELTTRRERYLRAKESALRSMAEAMDSGGFIAPWTREEINDRGSR